jgi:hypothetical protein
LPTTSVTRAQRPLVHARFVDEIVVVDTRDIDPIVAIAHLECGDRMAVVFAPESLAAVVELPAVGVPDESEQAQTSTSASEQGTSEGVVMPTIEPQAGPSSTGVAHAR